VGRGGYDRGNAVRCGIASYSNEFKVGILTLVGVVGAGWAILRTNDRPGSVKGYDVAAVFPSVQGVYESTQVRIAGVNVGSVVHMDLDGGGARLTLEMQGDVQLPDDSVAELKGEGVLGDRYVRVTPGKSDTMLPPGGLLKTRDESVDLDVLEARLDRIAGDVEVITGAVRTTLEDDRPQDQVVRSLDNVEQLTAQLAALTAENRQDVDAIADNVRKLTEALNKMVDQTGTDVSGELAALKQATDKLDQSMAHVQSVSEKIDQGQGTLGRLVNDDAVLSKAEHTLDQVGGVVDKVTGLHTEVYYRGSYLLGTDPPGAGEPANPVSGSARNLIGLRLMPREDYWYIFELVGSPLGKISYTEHFQPALGTTWTEYQRTPDLTYTLQFAKRYQDLVLRLGMKESSGGVGLDYLAFRDRLMLSADLYDFGSGSWPWLDGTPNLSLGARVTPFSHVFIEGGLENAILGLRHQYVTGFIGGGFTFTDDDFKFVLGTLPLP